MKKYQNALLAGVATLALIAGTGFASAQEQPNEHNGASVSHGMTGQHANTPATGANKTGTTAQNENQGVAPNTKMQTQQNANTGKPNLQRNVQGTQQNMQRNAQGATQQREHNARMQTTQHNAQTENMKNRREQRSQSTAERQRTMHGLQGNASKEMQHGQAANGTNVRLSEQQRSRIRRTIIESHNAPRVGHVDFNVNVGTVIPRSRFTAIRVVPVPSYLVEIEPRWRGYEYFVFQDEIVIVDPHDLRIVAIVPA